MQQYVLNHIFQNLVTNPLANIHNTIIYNILSVESQKGTINIQRCSVDNQKGTIAVQCL